MFSHSIFIPDVNSANMSLPIFIQFILCSTHMTDSEHLSEIYVYITCSQQHVLDSSMGDDVH